MTPYDNTEVVCQHQVVVAWTRLRETKKLTTYLIKAVNCFGSNVNNKKNNIRDNGNNNDNGDNNKNDNCNNNNCSSNYSNNEKVMIIIATIVKMDQ